MCCRVVVSPSPTREATALYLAIAGFEIEPAITDYWIRDVPGERTTVRARIDSGHLELSLYPSVTNWEGHANKRLAASLMFQTAALIAERIQGIISQHANVEGCREGGSTTIIAGYPESPLLFLNVCPGFKAVLLPQIGDVA